MIEINLLPGARKSKRGKGAALDTSAMMSGMAQQVKDPFLLVAIAGLVIGLGATAWLYMNLSSRQSAADERVRVALNDSTRYAGVIAERAAATAARDSIVRQFAIIKAIDGERYTWPHVLNEISAALPPYTWITKVSQTSPVISVVVPPEPPPDTSAAAKKRRVRQKTVDEIAATATQNVQPLKLRIVGQTVDVQAMTRYMRLLEQSPFLENVAFVGSDPKPALGEGVIEFTIDLLFQPPPPSAIRTVPLTIGAR
jgi:Tfp pilus assembly protein PilN